MRLSETEQWYLQMLKKNETNLTVTIKPELPQDKSIEDQFAYVQELSAVHALAALTIGLLGSCKKEDPKVSVAINKVTDFDDQVDQIDNLVNKDYYFANVLPKLEIIDADLDNISGQMNSMMQDAGTITIQQQTIDLPEANGKRSEFANKILAQNNQYLPAIDSLLSKLLYLQKHPDEEYVTVVGRPILADGVEEELTAEELEQRLCQNLELWHKHSNQAHTKVVEFMEFLKDYPQGINFPRLYDEAINIAISSKQDRYDTRVNFRLADLDIVMKTVHLAGLYQNRMLKALDNMNEEEWAAHFPNTPYPVTDAQFESMKANLNNEKNQLQDTYSKFFKLYNEIKVVE